MPQRLLQVHVPPGRLKLALSCVEQLEVEPLRVRDGEGEARSSIELLLPAGEVEAVLDRLQDCFPGKGDLKAVVLKVESSIPTLKDAEEEQRAAEEAKALASADSVPAGWREWIQPSSRISRDELHQTVSQGAVLDDGYLLTVVFSTIVATVGLVQDSPAVLVGAMVIAPLLGPNMALALSATLGDGALFAKSFRTAVSGILLALVLSVDVGAVLDFSHPGPELLARTRISLYDVALALSAGAAGALALTQGAGLSLVGVMVAVALLPPLITVGLMLATGTYDRAAGAILLLTTNVVGINVSAISIFLWRGFRPRSWWEAQKSARRSRQALTLWLVILATVALYILLGELGLVPSPAVQP
jgi:uncharacterized hydrophobic protein (TIGR00341 family)